MSSNTTSDQQPVRHTINKRWDNLFDMGGSISPIERWSDDNYAPSPLTMKQSETEQGYRVTAELHGFQAQDVHVDLVHDHLIILTSRTLEGSLSELYCKVPLPASVNKNVAEVEFSDGLLTVSFTKTQPGFIGWLRTVGQQLQKWVAPTGQREGAYPN
jgi:HSP20 family molecular chaperone IbpA